MTNTQARKQARIDILRTLDQAGLVQGIALTPDQLIAETRTAYWHGIARCQIARAKDSYLTFHFPGSPVHTRADDAVFLREIMIAINVFSKRSFSSEANHKLLETLEEALTRNGYEVEIADEIYEEDTALFHYPMTAFKIY